VISAKPSDPLDAFKHEIEAVEQAGPAEDDPAATDAAADYREGTPEELEFEDDDGTVYLWDPKLRKYMPAGIDGVVEACVRPLQPRSPQQKSSCRLTKLRVGVFMSCCPVFSLLLLCLLSDSDVHSW
jgi:hypothetical protein